MQRYRMGVFWLCLVAWEWVDPHPAPSWSFEPNVELSQLGHRSTSRT